MRDTPGRRRPTIGVVAGWQVYERTTPNWFLEAVYRGVADAAVELGCDVLLSCGVGEQIHDPREVRPGWPSRSPDVDFVPVGEWNTDGIVFVSPLRTPARRNHAFELQRAGFPVVFLGSGDGRPCVMADSAPGFSEAVEHLKGHGHSVVAFVAGDPFDLGDSRARTADFRRLCGELGLDCDDLVAPGLHSDEGGYYAMKALLETGRPFSAVLASNDVSAIGAMRALAECGKRVPEDVAVIGFDDQPGASAHVPPLATISYPLVDAGRRAVELVLALVRGQAIPEAVTVPTRLVRRRSCGCLHREANVFGPADEQACAAAENAPAAMAGALERARSKLPATIVIDLCRRLDAGLGESVQRGDSAAFEGALRDVLQCVEAGGDRAHRWHAALDCLRRATRQRLSGAPLRAAEDLLHLARVALSESADRRDSRRRVDDARQADLVSALTVPLQSARDEGEIVALVAEHAPPLGLAPASLAVYEPHGEDPVAFSRLVELGPGEAAAGSAPGVRVETRRLWREGLPPRDEPWVLCVLPLVRPGGPMGFFAFEAESLGPGAAVARQLAVALESVRLQAAVRALSLTDELTGIPNRRFFEQELKRECERARRFRRSLALLMVDVDHFKPYNDRYGHRSGDDALRRVARHLAAAVPRRLDAVARYGGEEFAVLLAETDAEGARLVAERIRESVCASDEFLRRLTISVGLAVAVGEECDPEWLVVRADEALYKAKGDGRNCVRS